jgi:class 3 adenylate cyclase
MLELHAARSAFDQLGAALDARRIEERLAGLESGGAQSPAVRGAARVVRTFAFTDIVDSTKLAELLGDEAWGKLVHWHNQIIRAVVAEHGGEEIKATGDGFFLAFSDAARAIEAMIAVQRRLADHRDRHGFAPAVRIGLHTAEASQSGLDYMGMGVNYAARIGAAAQGGEILLSDTTLAGATPRRTFAASAERTLQLKGISAPVRVSSIDWR